MKILSRNITLKIFLQNIYFYILISGGYVAPGDDAAAAGNYAAPSDDVPVYAEEELGGYQADDAGDPALDMLLKVLYCTVLYCTVLYSSRQAESPSYVSNKESFKSPP